MDTTKDAPLAGVGDPIDPFKWNGRYQNTRFVGWDGYVASFNTVNVILAIGDAESGVDEVSYTSDISDTLDRTLAAFSMPL